MATQDAVMGATTEQFPDFRVLMSQDLHPRPSDWPSSSISDLACLPTLIGSCSIIIIINIIMMY